MTKKPLAITAAALAVAAGAGGIAVAATGSGGAGELDADLVGNELVLTVEAKDADAVRVTYGGATQEARLVPGDDDGDDEDRDYVARFPAAADRTAGDEIAAQVAIVRGSDTSSKTLKDRLDVEAAEEDDDDFGTVTPAPTRTTAPATAGKPRVGDLDADLVRGDTIVFTVEARDAKTVKLRYAGTSKTATLDRDDDDDRDRDFTARFPAAAGDRTDGDRITVKATARNGKASATRTLTDRLDVDTDG